MLPLDLHVLGLPPAFNLSHDQTLQFKFDARRIKLRNELRVHSLRLGIHLVSEDIKNPCHFECPHRLSDKLLKSSCNAALSSPLRGGVYYAFLFQSQPVISGFFLFNRPGCL